MEQSLAALASRDAPPAVRAGALTAVDDHTLGRVVRERVDRRSSPDLRRPQADALAGLTRLLDGTAAAPRGP